MPHMFPINADLSGDFPSSEFYSNIEEHRIKIMLRRAGCDGGTLRTPMSIEYSTVKGYGD